MVSSPTSTRFSPGKAVLVLGGLTALTLYAVIFIFCIIMQLFLHWADYSKDGILVDLAAGPVAAALLNMLLWWLIVALPKRPGPEERALLVGILCGGFAPTVMGLSGLFFGWWVNGYFLNYQGMPSTNWDEIYWQLSIRPIVYTILFIWLTIPICVILNRWVARRTQITQ
jgi:hypothetical protein